ncbi:MAG: glycosyltransferase family 4 protein [Hyphomicrobiaceae bacterium]
MRVLIATDAWHPQVNGVVETLSHLGNELRRLGVEVAFLTPEPFRQIGCPGYPEIRLALMRSRAVAQWIEAARPDWVHIATEGPVGWAVRRWCLAHGRPFTTSYHTKFPEYAAKLLGLPTSWVYALERRFHRASAGILVATPSLESELRGRGFRRLMRWTRGVDTELFKPRADRLFGDGPVFLYVGRISREKNITAFLDADLPGCKVVVGTGPHLATLRRQYPDVVFTGLKRGEELARHYASADVFVFPSRTETFGLVLLEALASGVPVAAYPATGPRDIIEHGVSGILDDDLASAARQALALGSRQARLKASSFSWARSAHQFLDNIRVAEAAWRDAKSCLERAARNQTRPTRSEGQAT